jgi:hypothetical protein
MDVQVIHDQMYGVYLSTQITILPGIRARIGWTLDASEFARLYLVAVLFEFDRSVEAAPVRSVRKGNEC